MRKAENVNAPNMWGWVIGVAAGLVAFALLVVVGKFNLFPAAFLGGGVAVVVGLILGMSWWAAGASAVEPASRVRKIVPNPEAVVGEAPAQPVSETVPAHVAVVSAPPTAEAAPAPKAAKPKTAKPKTAKPKTAAKPKETVAKPKAAESAGPARLKAPREGKADDLKEIEGIGPALEKLVNGLGFYHFDQIAGWADEDVALVDAEMAGFKGRITRDRWVAQAKIIVSEGLEAFRERAKTNNY